MIVDSLESQTLSNTKYQKSLGNFKERRKERDVGPQYVGELPVITP